jgi:hypothetical protein
LPLLPLLQHLLLPLLLLLQLLPQLLFVLPWQLLQILSLLPVHLVLLRVLLLCGWQTQVLQTATALPNALQQHPVAAAAPVTAAACHA